MANDGLIRESSRTEIQRLEQLELQFSRTEPARAEVLREVLTWRRSWHTLAGKLQHVRAGSLYREWGFTTFDQYCADELGLRPGEVQKLLGALLFAQQKLAQPDGTIPEVPLAAVEIAAAADKARLAGKLDEDTAKEIKDAVLAGEPVAAVKRQLKAQMEAAADERRTPDDSLREAKIKARRAAAVLCEVLTQLAEARSSLIVGSAVADDLEALIERTRADLDRLVEALGRETVPAVSQAGAEQPQMQVEAEIPAAVPAVIDAKLVAWAEHIGATHGATLAQPFPPVGEQADRLYQTCPVSPASLTSEVKMRLHAVYSRWFHAAKKGGTKPASSERRAKKPPASPAQKPPAPAATPKPQPTPQRKPRTGRASPDDGRVPPADPAPRKSRRKAEQPGLFV